MDDQFGVEVREVDKYGGDYMENIIWDSIHGEVELNQIVKVEKALGIKFPKDYIGCAKINNGGYPSKEAFDFDARTEAVFNRLLSFHDDKKNYIVSVFNGIKDRLVDGVYPFADDPFGNHLCFDYRGNNKKPVIVFWDHEAAFMNIEEAVFKVCDTFTELLEKLYD